MAIAFPMRRQSALASLYSARATISYTRTCRSSELRMGARLNRLESLSAAPRCPLALIDTSAGRLYTAFHYRKGRHPYGPVVSSISDPERRRDRSPAFPETG